MTASAVGNAALFYAPDGYDPRAHGLNGRRVAGESFLAGFLAHGVMDEVVALTHGPTDAATFSARAAALGNNRPVRTVRLDRPQGIAPVGCLYYPGPNFAGECWRRLPHGSDAYAITAVTHSLSTKAVMQGFFDLRSAPQMPWDAVVATSRAARAVVDYQFDLADDYLMRRYPGAALPARPLVPVIPLGIDAASFEPKAGQRDAFRARSGIADADMVLLVIARLTPHEKFDPLPLYLAMAAARAAMPAGQGLHLILCGRLADAHARAVFVGGAAALMPEVTLHLVEDGDGESRAEVLAAADAFVFPIDNLQETFGLAPVEAMAAGLPVIASDWDGLRDTVTPETGILVPTATVETAFAHHLAERYQGGTDSYLQYLDQCSALTRVDVGALTRAIVTLAADPALRRDMGARAAARARDVFDWRVVIPQMQALWAEQDAIRRALGRDALRQPRGAVPVAPSPFALFQAFPSDQGRDVATTLHYALPLPPGRPGVEAMLTLRGYERLRRLIEDRDRIRAIYDHLLAQGATGATATEVALALKLPLGAVARVFSWLVKYDYVGTDTPGGQKE